MKVLIVGGGGREHALAWKAAQSELVERVYVAPGNAGTAAESCVENINISAEDIPALADFAAQQKIALTIIGPEAPLVMGIADVFAARGLACFGPSAAAARLEGSKTFAKDFLQRHAIPSAAYGSFSVATAAIQYLDSLDSLDYPIVIKADGLAAGKGVVIAESRRQAIMAITDMLTANKYGDAGNRVVVEAFLQGEEASFICMVDGKSILPLASSQDHKAAHDGDTGPNTGGMGAYSPAPIVDEEMHERILRCVIQPTVRALVSEGMRYTGFLYAGLMIGADRIPKVLEFNCRCGDPETQPIMLRLRSDLIVHCRAAIHGTLADERAQWDSRCALGVVMAADGYPDKYETGGVITGLINDPIKTPGKIFHAGTKMVDGRPVVAGGRVLCATASGDTVQAAAQAAYQLVEKIHWQGGWHRTDIGHRAIAREKFALDGNE